MDATTIVCLIFLGAVFAFGKAGCVYGLMTDNVSGSFFEHLSKYSTKNALQAWGQIISGLAEVAILVIIVYSLIPTT